MIYDFIILGACNKHRKILGDSKLNFKKILSIFIISIIVSLTPAIACEISAQNITETCLNINNNVIPVIKHPNLSKLNQENSEKNLKTTN
jgi:hypothetical protein